MASTPLPRAASAEDITASVRPNAWLQAYHRARAILQAGSGSPPLFPPTAASLGAALEGPGLTLGARWCTHACLLVFVAALALASKIDLGPVLSPEASDFPSRPAYQALSIGPDFSSQGFLIKAAVPITTIPDRPRDEWLTYPVQEYDTVWTIAESHGLTPQTLYWSNAELRDNMNLLSIGQEVRIPPGDGLVHEVEEGDTLESLAETYEVSAEDIRTSPLNEEALALGGPLPAGVELFIPGGYRELPRPAPAVVQTTRSASAAPAAAPGFVGTARFGWPTDASRITQYYWWGHPAIDIAGPAGTTVYASDKGCVETAGWTNLGYGYHIIINHYNGFRTLYAHLSQYWVDPGDCVYAGQPIGAIGSTGRSTGPHLHFEIRQGGWLVDPFGWL